MATFTFSAFADEYSPELERQIFALHKFGIDKIELRGVDGKNVAELSPAEAKEIRQRLDAEGITLSAVGSPLGKISIDDDIPAHLELTRRLAETANILGCRRMRGFSFYNTENKRDEVIDAVGKMADICREAGVLFCHENEKRIYGDTAERCLDLKKTLGDKIGVIFDPANFIQSGVTPYPDAAGLLLPYIDYLHIKDADADGTVVPAGEGIGCVEKLLCDVDRMYDGEIILTLEPHLHVFEGFSALERGERTKMRGTYDSAEEAFAAAVGAAKAIVEKVKAR